MISLQRGTLFKCSDYRAGIIVRVECDRIIAIVLCEQQHHQERGWRLRTKNLDFKTPFSPMNIAEIPRVASSALATIWKTLQFSKRT